MKPRLFLVLASATRAFAGLCDPPPSVAAALRTLPSDSAERRKALAELAKRIPDDFWWNRLFLDGPSMSATPCESNTVKGSRPSLPSRTNISTRAASSASIPNKRSSFIDRPDVQVVSFNTDDNPETARQFMRRNSYEFPVVLAKNFAEDLMPYFSIPRTWVIRNGAITLESVVFGNDGDRWIDRIAGLVK